MSPESEFDPIPTRESLLKALKEFDQAGWRRFFDTYWKLIYRVARAAGLSHCESEEVVQLTVISVARLMPEFKYRPAAEGGSFKSWLLRQTKWRIGDRFRAIKLNQRHLSIDASFFEDSGNRRMDEIPDPMSDQLERMWEEDWEKNLVDAALEQVKANVDPKHFQIFYFKSIKNWPALKVARNLKVSLANVYTVTHRITKLVKRKLKELHKYEQ